MSELPALMAALGHELGADRCWLYARDPASSQGIALVRWLRSDDIRDVPADIRRWNPEAPDLAARDPLFARALAGEPLDAIDDIEAGGCDLRLERALGHRAFMHLNLHAGGALWGTVQPGMVDRPRAWTPAERHRLLTVRDGLARRVAQQVRTHGADLRSRRLVGPAKITQPW